MRANLAWWRSIRTDGKVAFLGKCYSPSPWIVAEWGVAVRAFGLGPCGRSVAPSVDCTQWAEGRRLASRGCSVYVPRKLACKWLHPTRLETRTKESDVCASLRVANSRAQRKWRLVRPTEVRSSFRWGASSACKIRMRTCQSKSVPVGTRKMVNYAWVGRSQGKPWWRLVAVLTCKSIVKLGYRGERLIEPSSSWFPPKFPPG